MCFQRQLSYCKKILKVSVFNIQDRVGKIGINEQYLNKENFKSWDDVYAALKFSSRQVAHTRNTNETKIEIEMNLDGNGVYNVDTGLNFFNHMIEQLSKHSLIDLNLKVDGDLQIDEHHTIEDTGYCFR